MKKKKEVNCEKKLTSKLHKICFSGHDNQNMKVRSMKDVWRRQTDKQKEKM